MSVVPLPPASAVDFGEARAAFEGLLSRMTSDPLIHAPHGDVEDALWSDGTEVLRLIMQGHLDLRAEQERPVPIQGADGDIRTHVRHTQRKLETRFGTVEVHRASLGHRDVPALFPMDAELNLPLDQASHGVQRRVVEEVARGSFGEAVQAVATTTAARIAKRQVEEIAERSAQDFDAFYESRTATEEREADLLITSLDGKGITMRAEDLRPATRKAAEETQHKLGRRLSKGEKRNRKRMATVAAVYSVEPWVQRPEDIVRELREEEPRAGPRPRPKNKRVWASVEKIEGKGARRASVDPMPA